MKFNFCFDDDEVVILLDALLCAQRNLNAQLVTIYEHTKSEDLIESNFRKSDAVKHLMERMCIEMQEQTKEGKA